MKAPHRQPSALASALIGTLLLAACAGPGQHRPAPDRAAQARVEQLAASGYARPGQGLTQASQRWIVAGEALPVELALPAGGAERLPLIVYLPGMGESARAGARWRQAWARAGYAVLSVQALPDDELAWSSQLARAADFKGLARERRQPAQAAARLRIVLAVLEQARARAAAGDALMRRVDFNAIGLAAYELGAQAALAEPLRARARAVMLLGPVLPERATGADGPTTPLLLISSRRDQDPTGLEPDPPKRSRAAFEAQDAATLLMLGRASHAALAGALPLRDDEADEPTTGRGRGRREPMFSDATPMHPNEDDSTVVVEASSLAFWDAQLRGSGEARAWLRERAPAWSQGLAEWSFHQR